MRKLLGIITAGLVLSGCATNIPVHKDVGELKLNYQSKQTGAPTGLSVAIVSPEFAKNSANGQQQNNVQQQNPMLAMLMQQQMQQQNQHIYSANSVFESDYKARLTSAIQTTMEELISKRGFTTKGPFTTLDEINYGDKKSMYLISTPKLAISVDSKPTSRECSGLVCTEKGEIQVSADLTFKLIEPLTGQSMMTKRIDMTSLSTPKTYIKQWQNYVDPASVAGMVAKSKAPESLQDNTDKTMTEAINDFYQQAMSKLDTMLSREEILSFQADIAQLKALKRF